jgi:hypothetical protein
MKNKDLYIKYKYWIYVYMYTYIIIPIYYIHMIHNIYTYNILIISYYIHISEFKNKFKIFKILKIQEWFSMCKICYLNF